MAGVAACLTGIAVCGLAGIRKEAELTGKQKREAVEEFALGKGFAVATSAGILSACFAFGLEVGEPIGESAIAAGTSELYSNNSVLVVILGQGFDVVRSHQFVPHFD